MKDIVPKLQKSVLSDFYSMVEEDTKIQAILTGKDKRATLTQVSKLRSVSENTQSEVSKKT